MSEFEHLVPAEGLGRFLTERFGSSEEGAELSRLGEGHSNLTFLVRRGAEEWVLRRPPRGDILPGTHEMHREFAVMKALADNGMPVPVPVPIELCTDESYLGVPFYLMSYIEGVVVRGLAPAPFDTPERSREMGLELADRLADIHAVDWEGVGLAELARKPQEFLARNLRRMQGLYDAVRGRDVPEIDRAGDWLRANAPDQREVSLTHGDYKLDNVMFAPEPPARIAAVVDWEISTIGDPMVDLGWMLYFSPVALGGQQSAPPDPPVALGGQQSAPPDPPGHPLPGDGESVGGIETITGVGASSGYPSRAELAHRYAERTGRDLADLRFYTAMAGWKIAIIMEGSYRRFADGMADDPMFAALDQGVPALARRSLEIINGEVPIGV